MSDLLKINVNEHTEKKGALTYLSWAWAWAEVLKIDPAATWVAHQYGPQGSEQPCMWIGETAIVHTSVTINGLRRECLLPVMDNRNNAVKLPDARKISDAIMRCMTKAIAMHGLGLYIYAGEDLPQGDEPPEKPAVRDAGGVISGPREVLRNLPPDWQAWLSDFAPTVENAFEQQGAAVAQTMIDDAKLDNEVIVGLYALLSSKARSALKTLPRIATA